MGLVEDCYSRHSIAAIFRLLSANGIDTDDIDGTKQGQTRAAMLCRIVQTLQSVDFCFLRLFAGTSVTLFQVAVSQGVCVVVVNQVGREKASPYATHRLL